MRTDIINILFCLWLGTTVVSCSTVDDQAYDTEEPTELEARPVDLLVTIGDKAMKSQQAPTRTHRAATFQGMEQLVAIPYRINGNVVTKDDDPLIDLVGADEDNLAKEYDDDEAKYNTYYVDRCNLMTSTNRMLVYGKSKPVSTDPAINGKLSDLPTKRTKTENITFSLSSIRESTEAHADATALATYMTTIAKTPGWSTTTDPTLKSYYLDFIRMGSEGVGLMSGAAANIKAFVAALRALLSGRGDALSEAIIANIDNKIVSVNGTNYNIENITYPSSIGLPDGAAVIRWTKKKDEETGEDTDEEEFSVRTTTTTLDNINGINRYTYPAELVFFTDSPIWTSAVEVSKKTYQTTDKTWSVFLDYYYNGPAAVNTNTKAVAVEKPLQYGVANLQVTLTGMSATLLDAKGEEVANTSMSTLPLTGVIIGGQHTVGHNMKPYNEEQTDVDGRFIYETTVDATSLATEGYKTNTLVLQSYDDEKVPVILELQNDTGNAFTGKDGTVYAGTRFYLVGLIDPADKKEAGKDYTNRVFTQDYTTTMSMSISSLAKAYTSMPDLLAPRLEVGVQVVTKWIQATTTNVEL